MTFDEIQHDLVDWIKRTIKMTEMRALITKKSEPTSLEGMLPKRWDPKLELTIASRTVEGQPVYIVELDGIVGQGTPTRLGRKIFGDNSPLGYVVSVYGVDYRGGKLPLCETGLPECFPTFAREIKEFKDSHEVHLREKEPANKLMAEIVVTITGRRPDPLQGNPTIFKAEFNYPLREFNREAGYGDVPVKFD